MGSGNPENGETERLKLNATTQLRVPDPRAPRHPPWETRYPGFTRHPEPPVSAGNQQGAELAGESGAVSLVPRVSHSDRPQPCDGDPPLWGAEGWRTYFDERAAMREYE